MTAMSLEEAYLIDRLNPIHTGVNAPLWISCENSDRMSQKEYQTELMNSS